MSVGVVSSIKSYAPSLCSHTWASFQIPSPLTEVIAGSLGRRTLQDHGRYIPASFPQSFPKGVYGHLLVCMSTLGTIIGIPLRKCGFGPRPPIKQVLQQSKFYFFCWWRILPSIYKKYNICEQQQSKQNKMRHACAEHRVRVDIDTQSLKAALQRGGLWELVINRVITQVQFTVGQCS